MPAITPTTVGSYTPGELLGALEFFEAKYVKQD